MSPLEDSTPSSELKQLLSDYVADYEGIWQELGVRLEPHVRGAFTIILNFMFQLGVSHPNGTEHFKAPAQDLMQFAQCLEAYTSDSSNLTSELGTLLSMLRQKFPDKSTSNDPQPN